MQPTIQSDNANDIPLIYLRPTPKNDRGRLVIWLNGFGGDKDSCRPHLESLAALGFTALAFDPYQHGQRLVADAEELRQRIRSNIRRYFWPILARTSKEVPGVIDWALQHLDIDKQEIGIGGISMGGDISVAAAGLDRRIVLAIPWVATPDWLRPGTSESVGEPDAEAQACYDELNPLTHLERYAHCPRIVFQNGADDRQVPPDGSLRFKEALRRDLYRNCPERIDAVLHPGVAHQVDDAMWKNTEQLLQTYL
jgi:uncharacterized protein